MFVQILPTSTIRKVWRTLKRISLLILGLKGSNIQKLFNHEISIISSGLGKDHPQGSMGTKHCNLPLPEGGSDADILLKTAFVSYCKFVSYRIVNSLLLTTVNPQLFFRNRN